MPTFRLNIVFTGVDLDDDDVFESLSELPNVLWRSHGPYALASATVDAASALKAADLVTGLVTARLPSASPIRLDEDLVAIPDVASRVGVTREAVRNWANGTRHANFPLPRGVVGDGIKVWAWADVNRWLRENLNLGDAEHFPTAHDAALINALFSGSPRRHAMALAAATTWRVAETITTSTVISASTFAGRPSSWVRSNSRRCHLSVIPGGMNAAA